METNKTLVTTANILLKKTIDILTQKGYSCGIGAWSSFNDYKCIIFDNTCSEFSFVNYPIGNIVDTRATVFFIAPECALKQIDQADENYSTSVSNLAQWANALGTAQNHAFEVAVPESTTMQDLAELFLKELKICHFQFSPSRRVGYPDHLIFIISIAPDSKDTALERLNSFVGTHKLKMSCELYLEGNLYFSNNMN
jgi:hypothetical protein